MYIIRMLLDFGLVILIWMTQLIVYPGFCYYTKEGLLEWHGRYTLAVSVLVAPLMIGQLILHGWILYHEPNLLNWFIGFLIVLIWINTFAFAVPLHNQISSQVNVLEVARKLVSINWYRTVMWNIIFLISVYQSYRMWI